MVKTPQQIFAPSEIIAYYKTDSLSNFTLNNQSQTGTVSTTSGSNLITLSGNVFGPTDVGKRIIINAETKYLRTFVSSTQFQADSNFVNTNSNVAFTITFVSQWNDSSGNGNHLTQANVPSQPFLIYNFTTARFEVGNNTGNLRFLVRSSSSMINNLSNLSLYTSFLLRNTYVAGNVVEIFGFSAGNRFDNIIGLNPDGTYQLQNAIATSNTAWYSTGSSVINTNIFSTGQRVYSYANYNGIRLSNRINDSVTVFSARNVTGNTISSNSDFTLGRRSSLNEVLNGIVGEGLLLNITPTPAQDFLMQQYLKLM